MKRIIEALREILYDYGDSIDSQGSAGGDLDGTIERILRLIKNGEAEAEIIFKKKKEEKVKMDRLSKESWKEYKKNVKKDKMSFFSTYKNSNIPKKEKDSNEITLI